MTSVPNVEGRRGDLARDRARHRLPFDGGKNPADQVFLQPMLSDVSLAGVAFTRNPNGAGPYFIINYDDSSGRTDIVTSGADGNLENVLLPEVA